jgi:hypothetical protein
MAIAKRRPLAKPSQSPPNVQVEEPFMDSAGFRILGDSVEVHVSTNVKLAKNYQSAGIEASIKFSTPVDGYAGTLKAAQKKLRSIIVDEIQVLSRALDHGELAENLNDTQ